MLQIFGWFVTVLKIIFIAASENYIAYVKMYHDRGIIYHPCITGIFPHVHSLQNHVCRLFDAKYIHCLSNHIFCIHIISTMHVI